MRSFGFTERFRKVFSYGFHNNVFRLSGFCLLFGGVWYFECALLRGFTVIAKLITTRLTVAFINYFF